MGFRKLTKKSDRGGGRKVFGDKGAHGLSLGSAGKWSPEKFKALVFRVFCKDNGMRKKKEEASTVLYKYSLILKKCNH